MLTNDDVAVEDSTYTTGRRGVAGTVLVEKIVGAAAEAGADLAACKALGDRVNQATGSMGVALTSCTVPAAGRPDLRDRRGRDGDGGRHPRRARPPAGQARERRRDRRRAGRRDLRRPRARRRRARAAAGQRLRRHAADGAVPDVPRRRAALPRSRPAGRPLAGRQLHDLARDGRLLDHAHQARRRDDPLWDAPVHTAALRWGR